MTDDNEDKSPNHPPRSEETSEDPELRTDGGQTIASSPAIGGPSSTVEPDGAPSIDGPAIGMSSVNTLTLVEGNTEAIRDESPALDNSDRAKSVILQPFQELCGRLEAIQQTDHDVVLILSSGTLRLPAGSQEARICLNEFEGREGNQVRILRTPSKAKPLFVAID